MPPEGVTALLFVVSGFLAVLLGQFWLGVTSVAYGLVDALLDDCAHGAATPACAAGLLYDTGLLHFVDVYLQRLVALYSLTAFLFRHGFARTLARALLTAVAFAVTSSHRISWEEANLIYLGVYLGLLAVAKAACQEPTRRPEWVAASFAAYLFGFAAQQAARATGGDAARAAVCIAHVFFAADIVFVSLALGGPSSQPLKARS